MYPNICPFLCSSNGGCHWVIISEELLADPTNPTGGPEGAKNICNFQIQFYQNLDLV